MTTIKAILLLGGLGTRCEDDIPKQFLPLGNKMVYEKTLDTFEKSGLFSDILLVTPENNPLPGSIPGGKTRQESSYKGLLACGKATDFVVIHDAVRPFVSLDILKKNVDAVQKHHAVNTCIPTHDTINYVEHHQVLQIPKRSSCMRGQTPQSFLYTLIREAHETTEETNAPDDCSLVLNLGHKVFVVLGSDDNFKITTKDDYLLACNKLDRKELENRF